MGGGASVARDSFTTRTASLQKYGMEKCPTIRVRSKSSVEAEIHILLYGNITKIVRQIWRYARHLQATGLLGYYIQTEEVGVYKTDRREVVEGVQGARLTNTTKGEYDMHR